MSAPVTWMMLATALTFWCIGAAWGAGRTSRDEHVRYTYIVSQLASLRSAVRDIHLAEGYAEPDFWSEPEPADTSERTSWWRRVWQRKAVEPELGPVVEEPEVEPEPEPEFVPDPSPSTNPIVMPISPGGPDTAPDMKQAAKVDPLPALSQEEYEKRRRQAEAEWEATKAKIMGGGK